uniref:Uncharacterized protein n=1 Tax=Romanomermis culicivorax TaxID=13658 RepID=A0A915LBX3_ROMCU
MLGGGKEKFLIAKSKKYCITTTIERFENKAGHGAEKATLPATFFDTLQDYTLYIRWEGRVPVDEC